MLPTLIIAEVGSVHDGSFGNACKLIEVAAECGADAVKFQTHISSAETLKDAPMPPYFKGEPRYEYFERTGFTKEQWSKLKACAENNSIEFLSSPFSIEAVNLLESIGMTRYKVPSGEMTNIPLLRHIAQTKKPVLLSSGMSSWEELDTAVEAIRFVHDDLLIMQCTSEYPCPYEQVGLNVLAEMQERYNCPVGLSDHTLTIFAPIAATTLGAQAIEKHLTFSRKMYGSDACHSLEPDLFAHMVKGIRAAEQMRDSTVDKSSTERFTVMKEIFEKSIVSVQDIPAGTVITKDMLGMKKPGTGISASKLEEVIHRKTSRDLQRDALLSWEDLA